MNKTRLIRFISKYYLNGTVNSVILDSKSDKLTTRFISGDKTLLGELSMDKSQIEECEVGVYNTVDINISEILGQLGLDLKKTLEMANSDEINLKYLKQTEIAKNKKIFGSPTFIFQDEVFWGDDRLEDCIKWMN